MAILGEIMGRLSKSPSSTTAGMPCHPSAMGAKSLFQPGFNLTIIFHKCGYRSGDIHSERQLKNRLFQRSMLWWSYRFLIFNSTESSTSLWRWDAAVPVILVFASASEEEVISWALAPTHLLQFVCYIVIFCLKSTSCFCYWLVIYWHRTSRNSFIRRDFNFCLTSGNYREICLTKKNTHILIY